MSPANNGLLVQDGQGRGTRYYPTARAASSPANSPSSPDRELSSPDTGRLSDGKAPSPDDKGPYPPNEAVESEDAKTTLVHDANLQRLAEPVSRTLRADPRIVRETILVLCRDRFLNMRELAQLLNRGAGSLRDNYLSPMVKEKQLELRHPTTPYHPDQGYRSAISSDSAGDAA